MARRQLRHQSWATGLTAGELFVKTRILKQRKTFASICSCTVVSLSIQQTPLKDGHLQLVPAIVQSITYGNSS